MKEADNRRAFLAFAGAGALLAACRREERSPLSLTSTVASSTIDSGPPAKKDGEGEKISATEDLMREHGVIRRVLVVYREAASQLRAKPLASTSDALQKAARLMRSFAEDYHEKQLEEANIFPALMRAGGPLVATVSNLIAQHKRGREVTEYVLALTQKGVGSQAEALARTLESFARMYEEHAALEDTVVFPAWKKLLSPQELDQMSDRFEAIEHETFGKDGFDDAVEKVASIEKSLGIDLGTMTTLPPPKP